ncbi:unnamed protein product [Mycena citricolor]|nr:unnamed protein product [Mycena citricolor]
MPAFSHPVDAQGIASNWLQAFSTALGAADIPRVAECFHPEGWLRDVLVFTWLNRTLRGRARISTFLSTARTPLTSVVRPALDTRTHMSPTFGPITPLVEGVSSGFRFETALGHVQGYVSLTPGEDGVWRALMVFVHLEDIRGHEESGPESGIYGGHTVSWGEVRAGRKADIERDPHVLIVGAGQTGLNVAARFKQMGIRTLIIEKMARVGDVWRKRYPMLTLHTIKSHHEMLYQSYPSNWPTYTPRDKLADWLEQYAVTQDLVVWTSSQLLPVPRYDVDSRKWNLVIDRAGKHVPLRPAHIVIAGGTFGKPRTPDVPDSSIFTGSITHSSSYSGGASYAGKRVLVVGAGNSAADICQDLHAHGAQATMLQRSSSCVVSQSSARKRQSLAFPADVPIQINDFKTQAMPYLMLREVSSSLTQSFWDAEKELHEGLREAGLSLTMGKDGSGQFAMIYERFGGYWIDLGTAKLIRDRQVLVKHGVELARFKLNGVVYSDGTEAEVDAVVYATSFESIRDTMRPIFGDDVISQTSPVWGVDEEGELHGCYRPSGYPGLWFATGDFTLSRFCSKQLAIQIRALELGIL